MLWSWKRSPGRRTAAYNALACFRKFPPIRIWVHRFVMMQYGRLPISGVQLETSGTSVFFFVLIHAIKLCVFMVLLLLTKEKLQVFLRLRFLTGIHKKRNRNEGLDFISVCSMAKASVKWNLSGQYSFNLTTKLSSVWPCVFCTRWDGVLQSAASCSANLWLISEEVCLTRCVRGGPLQNITRGCAAKMVSVCKSTKVLKELGT